MNAITLVIGDYSDDGHGKFNKIKISSNLNKEQFEKALKKGEEKIKKEDDGINFIDDVCSGYESHEISKYVLDILIKLGLDTKIFEEYDSEEIDDIYIDCDVWVKIILFIATLGNIDFKYEIKEDDEVYIGGYGLFY